MGSITPKNAITLFLEYTGKGLPMATVSISLRGILPVFGTLIYNYEHVLSEVLLYFNIFFILKFFF